jgi:CxxC motif-containing protein (DUF1111 family)
MTVDESDALVAFVRAIPRPNQARPSLPEEAAGSTIFQAIGCATCHVPVLGNIDGIYSDLLLHDLGPEVNGLGGYSTGQSSESSTSNAAANTGSLEPTGQEWRTPPLWGLRDSAPYMHDGSARSLAEVLRRHGGEASESASRYGRLNDYQRMQIQSFLLSLRAPHSPRGAKRPGSAATPSERFLRPASFAEPLHLPAQQTYRHRGYAGFCGASTGIW